MATYTSNNVIGVNFDRKTTVAEHKLGTVVNLVSDTPNNQARFAIYVHASAAIGNSNYATVDLATIDCTATSADSAGSGTALYRNGSVAFVAGEYGWLMAYNRIIRV